MNVCSIDDNVRIASSKSHLSKLSYNFPRKKRTLVKLGVMLCTLIIISTVVVSLGSICPVDRQCSPEAAHEPALLTFSPHRPHVAHGADNSKVYKLILVADLDDRSRVAEGKEEWQSFLLEGKLTWDGAQKFTAEFDTPPVSLRSDYSRGGRGMELSELIMLNGDLLSVDDRSGIVFKLIRGSSGAWEAVPWVLLTDGNGEEKKGFKAEWMTVKGTTLYVGGLGKEWTSIAGEYMNDDPMFIKKVSLSGVIQHVAWKEVYLKLRKHLNISSPGYVIHEAVMWSEQMERWLFLPRRVSHEKYNDRDDEKRGSNILMLCTEDFISCEIKRIGFIVPTRGFSSFKFLPGTNERIVVALKSEENNGEIATYISVFEMSGRVLLADVRVGNEKYEGIEFV